MNSLENLFDPQDSESELVGLAAAATPNHTPRTSYPSWPTILISLLSMGIFFAGVYYWTSTDNRLPASSFQLRGVAAIAKLQRGSLITLAGLEVGRVERVVFEKGSDNAVAQIQFHHGIEERLPSDTRFRVGQLSKNHPKSSAAHWGVEVHPGTQHGSKLPDVLMAIENESSINSLEFLNDLPVSTSTIVRAFQTLSSMRFVILSLAFVATAFGIVYRFARQLLAITFVFSALVIAAVAIFKLYPSVVPWLTSQIYR
jgi:hypothetical protein